MKRLVERVVDAGEPGLDACMARAKAHDPDLVGAWELRFSYSAQGELQDVDATGQGVLHLGLELCLEDEVRTWTGFPSGRPGSVVKMQYAGDW